MEKKLDTGEIVCGFGVRKDYEGQKDFEQTYKEVTIKKRVKKIGDGEADFLIEEFDEVKETPIREVLMAQVDQVGIEAYMRPYLMSGTEPEFVGFDDINKAPVQDFSKFPDDIITSQEAYQRSMELFYSLDPMLRGDAKTPEEFLNSISDDKLKAYYAIKLNVGKKEDIKDDK